MNVNSSINLRKLIVDVVCQGGGGHIPSSFSIVDIIDVIFKEFNIVEREGDKNNCDSFTLSKGHGACALYAVLLKYGLLRQEEINSYLKFNSILGGHPDATKVPGAEASTGSLGHGLSFTVGRALASKIKGEEKNYFVLVGDGECHEGTVWEAAIVANNLGLSNLFCLIDYNKSSDQICPHNSLYEQFKAFGWNVLKANGHDKESIKNSIDRLIATKNSKPNCVVFDTIKGKGVSFMENNPDFHGKTANEEQLREAIKEINSN